MKEKVPLSGTHNLTVKHVAVTIAVTRVGK